MEKVTHHLAGALGEQMALAKLLSLGLKAYVSPPGAPGHDLVVTMPEGSKSIEVKARQFLSTPKEITRWPVDMNTKDDADYFLFVEIDLSTISPTFYLLNGTQAKGIHDSYQGNGNCPPGKVRRLVAANDFGMLTGEPSKDPTPVARKIVMPKLAPVQAQSAPSQTILQEATFNGSRVVQYTDTRIEVFENGVLQRNAYGNLRPIANALGISEFNARGGKQNTRQLGKLVIDALKTRQGKGNT